MVKQKFDEKGKVIRSVKGYIAAEPADQYVKSAFKGEVIDIPIKFPHDLGTKHPFNFEDIEQTYKRVGIISGGINKITDSIVGDFLIKCNNEKAKKILDDFINQTDFATVLREWIREGFLKGSGFMEIDLAERKVRVLNANDMYVKRSKKGIVLEYNQWLGNYKRYSRTSSKLTTFKPKNIAHLRINKVAGEAYGIGIVWPNERVIENLVLNEQELHRLISRKAGAPIHVKVGMPGEAVNPKDVTAFKDDLQFLTNNTEWVTDGNVEMKVIDFGDLGKNLTDTLNYDMQTLAYGMEIPIVLFGAGNIPEGLAKVQLEAWQRKMASLQEEIESIIEEQIFKPLLEQQGMADEQPEFIWNLPGEEEINRRIERLTKLIESINVSEPLRRMCELQVAQLLDLEDAHKYLSKPEKEKEPEEEPMPAEEPKPEPSQPEPKPQPEPRKQSGTMTIKEFVNLTAISGADYSECLVQIFKKLRTDKFESLGLAADGTAKIRVILKESFRRNKTINQVSKELKDSIIFNKGTKASVVAKTEIIRLSNLGLSSIVTKGDED